MDDLIEFEKLVANHDWYFNYSDDSRAYDRGRKQQVAIRVMRTNLENQGLGEEADAIFKKYQPKGAY